MDCNECGHPVGKYTPVPMQPITKNTTLNEEAHAFLLQNKGDTVIKLDSWFSLVPNQQLSFGNTGNLNTLVYLGFNVKFQGVGNHRLEIMKMVKVKT